MIPGERKTVHRALPFVLLLATVMVWGGTFPLVKDALADASPLVFNLLRFLLAAALLLLLHRRSLRSFERRTLAAGLLAGGLLAAGYELQTAGLARTSAIHSAFLTGLVVVFVPLLSLLPGVLPRGARRPGWTAIAGAWLAVTGVWLLAIPADVQPGEMLHALSRGDLLTLGCALAFAGHLLVLARLAHLPTAHVATVQIAACALVMLLLLPAGGAPHLHLTMRLAVALVFTATLATAAAFSVQTWAQQHLPPTSTALVLTLEPVFAAVFSMLFLGERISLRALLGACLILAGLAVTEIFAGTKPLPFEAA